MQNLRSQPSYPKQTQQPFLPFMSLGAEQEQVEQELACGYQGFNYFAPADLQGP